ncbi:iron ABC transporter permease [Paracoccus caeni]|uniref:Iron ABC transporter permease n=1 Tax=Paracoccus caeni TaxID=657651 RepID=A0A934SE23_9RHOB|nr:iron ABC transporter permease [Paracoccus caeni]MBK4215963.1 iron ABC transporter permease [Paracoccus caeni]
MRVTLIAALAMPLLLLAALGFGDRPIPLGHILSALTGFGEAPPDAVFILNQLRLPRALLAMTIGAALALAGAICQAAMRNPLAEPGLIGINGGAALAALVLIIGMPGVSLAWLPWAAFGGAMVMVALIQGLAIRVGMRSQRIILIGIGCGALTGGIAGFLSSMGDIILVQRSMIWMAGSLQDSRWEKLWILLMWMTPAMILLMLLAPVLDLLGFEDPVVRGLGVSAPWSRAGMLALCALIAAAAVAATGPIGFVGLIAPHIARHLVGAGHRRLLPLSALMGAGLLLLADTVGRSIIAPAQIPAGILTALLGAPFFGWLMWRHRND